MEEQDDGRAPEASPQPKPPASSETDVVAARTRALVEESRELLRRLERLLGRDGDAVDGGDGRDPEES